MSDTVNVNYEATLPEHKVVRDENATKVWHLIVAGEKVASFTTFCMAPKGGVFCIRTGKGWTMDMADRAFRAHLGGQTA